MRQPHSWMEYQYRISGANDNHKMWIKDEFRIHQIANGSYYAVQNSDQLDGYYDTFEEAKEGVNKYENDNLLQ